MVDIPSQNCRLSAQTPAELLHTLSSSRRNQALILEHRTDENSKEGTLLEGFTMLDKVFESEQFSHQQGSQDWMVKTQIDQQ